MASPPEADKASRGANIVEVGFKEEIRFEGKASSRSAVALRKLQGYGRTGEKADGRKKIQKRF